MATITNRKENSSRFSDIGILSHPVLIGSVIAAMLLLISSVPVTVDSDKLYVLLTISSALMIGILFVIRQNLSEKAKSHITEKKEAVEAQKKSMANLSAIIENTDSSIYSLDANYRYIAFNQILFNNLKNLYGLEIKEGDHVFAFLEKLEQEEAKDLKGKYSRALNGETIKFEREFNIGDFKKVADFSIYPIWQNTTVIGLSCFTRDITNQKREEVRNKQMTADLIQRNKDLEQFSYIVSHNLRGPVANILGLSNIIREISLSPGEKEKTRDYLFDAVKQLDVVITDLNQTLDVRRNILETKEEINFSELVDGIKSGMHICMEKRKASVHTDFSDVKGMFSVRSYIQNVFYNLISNSLKYAQPGIPPVINIKSENKENTLFIYFSDNGLGIDLELCMDKLFGLYQRFHTGSDGKGMGLFMVKTQVEAMGGKISLTSAVNKGTTVVLEFPSFRAGN